jgi:hypothetical protein
VREHLEAGGLQSFDDRAGIARLEPHAEHRLALGAGNRADADDAAVVARMISTIRS